MNKVFKLILILLAFTAITSCSSSQRDDYTALNQIAIDSTNDRIFLSQSPQEMFVLTASTGALLDVAQPLVSADEDATTSALLPFVVSKMAVYVSGITSRLFVMGAFENDAGVTVLNRIRVLDFDGTTFTEVSFSPIILSDDDDTTDETDDSFADIIIDNASGNIYVSDASVGLLYTVSAVDGTEVQVPIAIAGSPQGLSLDNGRLYVCNASANVDEQLITVINTADFTATNIDLDIPCRTIAVSTGSGGTVMFVKNSDAQQIMIRSVDTTTYAASTAIASASSSYASGILTADAGISSSIYHMVLVENAGLIYGYLSELDGTIDFLTFASDLSSYSLATVSTLVSNITHGDAFLMSDDATQVYFVTQTGALLSIDVGVEDVSTDY